jgi:2-polyprenyl-3-methyl-5-hydroxy-6-metoxy-1,4-benzoquinol methylase
MFLSERSTQAEYFDSLDRSPREIAEGYEQLGRVNRIFKFSHPFEFLIPRCLDAKECARLRILDLGAGDGLLGRELRSWAARQGWDWQVTDLDLNVTALQLNNGNWKVGASVLNLPFTDSSFDVVIASQMTHHLDLPEQICQHFREAWRVARELVVFSDLHRNAAMFLLVRVGTRLARCSRELAADGVISIRRGFRVGEWRRWAAEAGIPDARVSLYLGARVLLHARKRHA